MGVLSLWCLPKSLITAFNKSTIYSFFEGSVLLITVTLAQHTTLMALCFCSDGSFGIFKIILPQHDTRS